MRWVDVKSLEIEELGRLMSHAKDSTIIEIEVSHLCGALVEINEVVTSTQQACVELIGKAVIDSSVFNMEFSDNYPLDKYLVDGNKIVAIEIHSGLYDDNDYRGVLFLVDNIDVPLYCAMRSIVGQQRAIELAYRKMVGNESN